MNEDLNGVAIEVHLFGFENDDHVAEKKEFKEYNSKTKQETTVIKSQWVFNYRHSMSLRVVHPNLAVYWMKCLIVFQIQKYPKLLLPQMLTPILKAQSSSVENNLKTIQWLINDKLGTTEQSRDIEVVCIY